jgi:hypothetical protein
MRATSCAFSIRQPHLNSVDYLINSNARCTRLYGLNSYSSNETFYIQQHNIIQHITMERIQIFIYYRYQQGIFLRMWNRQHGLRLHTTEIDPIQQYFPSLYTASVSAIQQLDPVMLGSLFSMMRRCAGTIAVLLLQDPETSQLSAWSAVMRNHIMTNCPFHGFQGVDFLELIALLQLWMDERRANDPRAAAREASMLPIHDVSGADRAAEYNLRIVSRFFKTWMAAVLPSYRQHLTFRQFFHVSQGLRRAEMRRSSLPDLAFPIVRYMPGFETSEDEYRPTGDRVQSSAFCQPVEAKPAESTCSVCHSDPDIDAENPGKKLVVTACNHHFHEECLSKWVNESAMQNANTCPTCHGELCKGRPRVPTTTEQPVASAHRTSHHEYTVSIGEEAPSWEELLESGLDGRTMLQIRVRDDDAFYHTV